MSIFFLPAHNNDHYMVPSSLFDCFSFSSLFFFSCVCLRVLCRRLKVRQIDAKGPRIYQMELSDYLRFFFFFLFFYLSIDVFTPVVNTRSSYTSVPKTNKPLFSSFSSSSSFTPCYFLLDFFFAAL